MPIIGFPSDTPKEITNLINDLFGLYEIRARVFEKEGISFNIYIQMITIPHIFILSMQNMKLKFRLRIIL